MTIMNNDKRRNDNIVNHLTTARGRQGQKEYVVEPWMWAAMTNKSLAMQMNYNR